MRCFINFSLTKFSNSYLIASNDTEDAIIVDPGEINLKLLKLIEDNNLYVRHILVTHSHKHNISGIRTLFKIYNAEIYSASDQILSFPSNAIVPNSFINLSNIEVEVMKFPGHSEDSLVYKIGKMLFTGDTLCAGNIGNRENKGELKVIGKSMSTKIKNIDDNILVFPSHGPPSTIKAEKDFNPELI